MTITRIVKLRGFKNVLSGRDLSNILKEGHVYSVTEIDSVIMLEDLGEHALPERHNSMTISQIMMDGTYCLTKGEKTT
jgi:hypothetical protein